MELKRAPSEYVGMNVFFLIHCICHEERMLFCISVFCEIFTLKCENSPLMFYEMTDVFYTNVVMVKNVDMDFITLQSFSLPAFSI